MLKAMSECFDISVENKSASKNSLLNKMHKNELCIFSLYLRMYTVFNYISCNQLYKNSNGSLHFYSIFN